MFEKKKKILTSKKKKKKKKVTMLRLNTKSDSESIQYLFKDLMLKNSMLGSWYDVLCCKCAGILIVASFLRRFISVQTFASVFTRPILRFVMYKLFGSETRVIAT